MKLCGEEVVSACLTTASSLGCGASSRSGICVDAGRRGRSDWIPSRISDYQTRSGCAVHRAQTFPIRNAFGEVVRMAGVAEDMTEQRRVQETLVKTERQFRQSSRMEAIGTLAGGIAHDFNNILTAILGYTELGLASVPKGSRTQRNLQEVLTAGHRAKHLVLQILAFSRQSGQGKKPIPIHTVIQEALKLLRASIPSTIEIRHSLMTEASVLADSTQLHQVVINLCTNAEYAMREKGGLLEITLEDLEVTEKNVRAMSGLQVGPHVRLTIRRQWNRDVP